MDWSALFIVRLFGNLESKFSLPNDEKIKTELYKYWDEGEIVEMLGVISLFGYLNRWNDSMGTKLEDPAADDGVKYLQKKGWSRGKHEYK